MLRRSFGAAAALLLCLVLPAAAQEGMKGPDYEGPRMAIHLIATYDYPTCGDMVPASVEEIKADLDREDLVKSNGFGYICFLVQGVDGLAGLEFALQGVADAEGLKLGKVAWCSPGALTLGDFLGEGGIVSFPCLTRLEGDEFIPVGYLPFEYRGTGEVEIRVGPSSFTKRNTPMTYILDCSATYAEHEITEATGGRIEAFVAPTDEGGRDLGPSRLLWSLDPDEKVMANRFAEEPGLGRFPFSLVGVAGHLSRFSASGALEGETGEPADRWIVAEGGRRALRLSRSQGSTGDVRGWDLALLNEKGEEVWSRPGVANRAWISHDGTRVAWQSVAHAGRLEESVHLWVEGRGEVRAPAVGLREAAFRKDGSLAGWGQAQGVVGKAGAGDWGVLSIKGDGALDWWRAAPEAKVAALAVSGKGVALARVESGRGLAIDVWGERGEPVFTGAALAKETPSPDAGHLALGLAPDASFVAAAWAPRGEDRCKFVMFDVKAGHSTWERDPQQDLGEKGVAPDRIVFSEDGKRLGLLSVRIGAAPLVAASVYEPEGTLLWRRKKINCTGTDRDLLLSATGDRVFIVGCSRAYLYEVKPQVR